MNFLWIGRCNQILRFSSTQSITVNQISAGDHRAAEPKEKLEDKVCARVYGAIAKQRLQKRLGRTKSLDQALNNAKLIRKSQFHDGDLWRNASNDETPSFEAQSQNATEQGLADSSQTKGSDLTRILEELHLNADQLKVKAQKVLNLEDSAEVEKDPGLVSEDNPVGDLVEETNTQVKYCPDV